MKIPEGATLEMKIRLYLAEFEKGCTDTLFSGKPEECSVCVRAFVNAVTLCVAGPDNPVKLRFDMNGTGDDQRHPSEIWESFGLQPLRCEAFPIADCWMLWCTPENLKSVTLPSFIERA